MKLSLTLIPQVEVLSQVVEVFNRVIAHCLVRVCLHVSYYHTLLESRDYILFRLYL